eukprot:1942998-Pyramimonas_sp.AAC.1
MAGHIFLDASWMGQHLPPASQAVGWAIVSVQPRPSHKVISVMCGTLQSACRDVDCAELLAFNRAL